MIIGSIYRHHHHSINEFNNYLEDVIRKISSENKLIYLAGDFNIDILKNNGKYIDDFLDLIPRESKKIVQELQMSLTLIKSLNHRFVVVLMKKT